jgi:DNA-binding CsgD family transcriptional regulator
VRGRTAKEISEHIKISRRTVEHHIEHIKEKSRCRTRSELVDKFYDALK